MKKEKSITIVTILLIIMGLAMIYLGGIAAPKLVLPPVISGFAFLVTAWGFYTLKNKK